MKLNRRLFLGTGAAAAATLAAPTVFADGHGKPRVVVVGGGAGGATAARYIAKDSKGEIAVTLIEPTRMYYTCFFSNLYLGGVKEIDDLGHSYGNLAAGGVNVCMIGLLVLIVMRRPSPWLGAVPCPTTS
jgi:sulfide dehydrogenase [flavocytochrome c] flavoprotein subunit